MLVLGVAYKNDIDDYRESPALPVIENLEKRGAEVEYFDPWIPKFRFRNDRTMVSIPELKADIINAVDIVVITAAHTNVDYKLVSDNRKFISTRKML